MNMNNFTKKKEVCFYTITVLEIFNPDFENSIALYILKEKFCSFRHTYRNLTYWEASIDVFKNEVAIRKPAPCKMY